MICNAANQNAVRKARGLHCRDVFFISRLRRLPNSLRSFPPVHWSVSQKQTEQQLFEASSLGNTFLGLRHLYRLWGIEVCLLSHRVGLFLLYILLCT